MAYSRVLIAGSFLPLPAHSCRRSRDRAEVPGVSGPEDPGAGSFGFRPWSKSAHLRVEGRTMVESRHWSVDIFIDEHEDERTTRAEARLHTNDQTQLVGRGTARRNPKDTDIAEIGD